MNMLNSVFDWMLGSGLRASVLVLVVLLSQWLFRRRLPSRWRYALWLPVLAALLVPALPLLPAGMNWPATQAAAVEVAPVPAVTAPSRDVPVLPTIPDPGAVSPATPRAMPTCCATNRHRAARPAATRY